MTVTATDDGVPVEQGSVVFTWTVTDTNRSPILDPIADLVGDEMTLFTFTATGSDPDFDGIGFSLATHDWVGRERTTTWHRGIIWNLERMGFGGVRITRKGSKVKITGRRTTFETRDGRTLEQIEVSDFRILQLK